MTSIFDALKDARYRFEPVSSSANLDAQLLLAQCLGQSRAYVIAHKEQILTQAEQSAYETVVARRAQGEPIAYILGTRAFYDREFIVSPAVLIPRPETEHLIEAALDFIKIRDGITAVDVGTGSGAIIVTVKANAPHINAYATDISPDALHIARKNATENSVEITFFQGNLVHPLIDANIHVDLLMANLPYIGTETLQTLDVRKFEPHLALDGGADGLDLIRELLLEQCPQVCNAGALILLEIGADQGEATRRLAQSLHPVEVKIIKDYAGHDRIVSIRLP
ncbi:MAG: peptide chain release factor N(5)-glutamine methyltransferase [Aggregatilineales bacterium]